MTSKWLIWNFFIGFIIVDGTIGITGLSPYMANIVPFLCFALVILGTLFIVVMLLQTIIMSTYNDEELQNIKSKIPDKISNVYLDIGFDTVLVLILAAHAFYFSAILYGVHTIIGVLGRAFFAYRNNVLEEQVNYTSTLRDECASCFNATCLLLRRVRSLTVAPHVYSQVPYEVFTSCTDNVNIQLLSLTSKPLKMAWFYAPFIKMKKENEDETEF
jgi:hypothetical protein